MVGEDRDGCAEKLMGLAVIKIKGENKSGVLRLQNRNMNMWLCFRVAVFYEPDIHGSSINIW